MEIRSKTTIFTVIFALLGLISAVIYDVYAMVKGGTEATISHMMFEWSYKYPIFTFSCGFFPGVLVGHFFWRIRDGRITKIISDNSRESVDSTEVDS